MHRIAAAQTEQGYTDTSPSISVDEYFSRYEPEPFLRCLLVADEGRPTESLHEMLEDRCRRGPCEFHVVVPRHRREVLVSDPAICSRSARNEITVWGEDTDPGLDYDVSAARLDCFLRSLADLGQPLTGEVEEGNLVRKVRTLTTLDYYHEVLVMARPRRRFWGRRRDLAASLRRACRIPVTAITVDESAA